MCLGFSRVWGLDVLSSRALRLVHGMLKIGQSHGYHRDRHWAGDVNALRWLPEALLELGPGFYGLGLTSRARVRDR